MPRVAKTVDALKEQTLREIDTLDHDLRQKAFALESQGNRAGSDYLFSVCNMLMALRVEVMVYNTPGASYTIKRGR